MSEIRVPSVAVDVNQVGHLLGVLRSCGFVLTYVHAHEGLDIDAHRLASQLAACGAISNDVVRQVAALIASSACHTSPPVGVGLFLNGQSGPISIQVG